MGYFVLTILVLLIIYAIWRSNVRNRRFNEIYTAAKDLKRKAQSKGGGSFYKTEYQERRDFLDYMGQFFKSKKHEWIFLAFMDEYGQVKLFWLNKGMDNKEVSLSLSTHDIKRHCNNERCSHILIGHNHPAGALKPSKQDRISLENYLDELAKANISVEYIVFVAGSWKKYRLSIGQRIRRSID